MFTRMHLMGIVLLIAGFGARSAHCAVEEFVVYKVGGSADCPYHNIQDAIDAAAAHPGEDYVWIASDQSYSDQHVVVSDQDVIIEGGFTDCDDIDPGSAQTILNGTSDHSVLEIEGSSNVYVGNLVLTGAQMDSSHRGGGVYFGGQGSLELANTTVNFNSAGYGAGIDVNGGTGPANLVLHSDTLILSNTASVSGGGIRVEGNARLFVLEPRTLIAYNQAPDGYGGGIEVIGPAQADIGSGGYNGLPVIFENQASYGGGMDAFSVNDGQDTLIRLFTTDPANPVSISSNIAYRTGGAVYLKSLNDLLGGFAITEMCASDFRMEDNIAEEGTAIYADTAPIEGLGSIGAQVAINTRDGLRLQCSIPEPPTVLGAVHCAPGVLCNRIYGNVAEDELANPTDGSAVLIQSASTLLADRISIQNNTGGHALRVLGDDDSTQTQITDCLIADNTLTGEAITMTDGNQGSLIIDSCTIAENTMGASAVMSVPSSGFYLLNSIIDEVGHITIDPPALNVAYVLSNDTTSLPVTANIIQGSPDFVDAEHGDFHLRSTSVGVDFAPGESSDREHPLDLDGLPRIVDLPGVPQQFGPMDLGAYETQVETVLTCANADTIFCDGFGG